MSARDHRKIELRIFDPDSPRGVVKASGDLEETLSRICEKFDIDVEKLKRRR